MAHPADIRSGSPMASLRAAIAGFGGMGQRHLQALRQLGVVVVGVADLRPEAQKVAEAQGVKAYDSWETLLEKGRPDAMVVATNGPSHYEITVAAATAGVEYILCEKPMAISVAQADEMIRVCKERDVRLAVNHFRRYHPGYQRLRKLLLDERIIGSVGSIIVTCRAGGLACVGCHFFDLMRLLSCSEPATAAGWEHSLGVPNPRGAMYHDPGGYGVISFHNKTRGFIDMSEDIGVPQRVEIVGTWGRVVIDEPEHLWRISARSAQNRGVSVTRRPPLHDVAFDPGPKVDIVDGTVRLLRNLFSDEEILAPGEDGRQSLAIYAGLRASMLDGHREVSFPLPDPIRDMEFPIT